MEKYLGLVATKTSGATKNVWKYSQLTLKISTGVNHLEALLIMKFIEVALKLKFRNTPDVS